MSYGFVILNSVKFKVTLDKGAEFKLDKVRVFPLRLIDLFPKIPFVKVAFVNIFDSPKLLSNDTIKKSVGCIVVEGKIENK